MKLGGGILMVGIAVLGAGAVFVFSPSGSIEIGGVTTDATKIQAWTAAVTPALQKPLLGNENAIQDVPPPGKIGHIPPELRALYATSWSVSSPARLAYLSSLIEQRRLNAMIVDVKDYSGVLLYPIALPQLMGTQKIPFRISRPNSFIRSMHQQGVYLIGRISVFQDELLAKLHPEWAIHDAEGNIWRDHKGIPWLDPAAREVWRYAVAVARDALDRGFDEVNFDYIRFPSDGNIDEARYPFWSAARQPKSEVIREFSNYVRNQLAGEIISADIFGISVVKNDDLGIGQKFESFLPFFDYVMPMTYPSHYSHGFLGYDQPAEHPYEVVRYSLARAVQRRQAVAATVTEPLAKIRIWVQSFDIHSRYDRKKIQAQINAIEELRTTFQDAVAGWALWDPANRYQDFNNGT